jgi:hypothetical protein
VSNDVTGRIDPMAEEMIPSGSVAEVAVTLPASVILVVDAAIVLVVIVVGSPVLKIPVGRNERMARKGREYVPENGFANCL